MGRTGETSSDCQRDVYRQDMEESRELLRYSEYIRSLGAEGQQAEYARVEQSFQRHETSMNRIKLALLLSLPDAPFRNDARARDLLQRFTVLNSGSSEHYRDFSTLLLRTLNEKRNTEQTVEAERKQQVTLRKQVDELRKQVEELKAIEQHINQRDQNTEREIKP